MKRAKREDRELVINMLTKSFDTNLSVNYIIRQDNRRERRIRALMSYSFEVCHLFGEVFLSDDKKACALIVYPDKKRTTAASIWLDIQLICRCIGLGNVKKSLSRETLLKKVRGKESKAVLWFIGVNPDEQHKGFGSHMLKSVIDYSEQNRRPVYLETSNRSNLPWYAKFGFQIYAEKDLGHTLYFLRRQIKR